MGLRPADPATAARRGAALPWLLRHFAGRPARLRPGRAVIQVAAIAAGVALGYAVHLINASALAEFSAAEGSLSGAADLAIVGPSGGFDEAWYARIAGDPAVALAAPLLETDVTLDAPAPAQRTGAATGAARPPALRIVGLDALRSAALEPDLVGVPAAGGSGDRRALLGDGLYLSPAALAQWQLAPGQSLRVVVGERRVALPIAGTLPAAHGAVASMDIGFAQWRLERLGQLTRIAVKLRPGAASAATIAAWHLPPYLHVERHRDALDRQQGLSRAYRVNLDVLAMVALFTGAFLIFSLQSQAIVVRRPQLALLRMLGASRATVVRLLVLESLGFGLLGALLGLAFGAALAALALRTLGGDLGGGYFAGLQPALDLEPRGAALFCVLGLAAAVAGAWLPAREAARQPPAPALKAGVDPAPGPQRARAGAALGGIGLAALLLLCPPLLGIPVGAYAAIGLLLVATIALKPLLAPRLFDPLARWVAASTWATGQAWAWLAATRLARLPRFAAVGAAGIVASFALMVAMATMVDSFRNSFDAWLSTLLSADLYARAAPAGATGRFSAHDLQWLRADPDIARAEFARTLLLPLDPARAPVALTARSIDRGRPQQRLPLIGDALSVPAGATPVWVSEAMVDLYGARPGSALTLALGNVTLVATVAGVWRDYARQGGSIAIDTADYERLTGDTARTDAALWLRPGADAAQVQQRLLAGLEAPAVQFARPGEIRAISLRLFDRSFQVTYLLEWAAIAIGLLGLATTFSAQAVARTREFGMLRHLGVSRAQVLALLAGESVLVTLLAVLLGLVAGLATAWILVAVVNPQSFHWTMDLHVPAARLALLSGALLLAAGLSSAVAGRRVLSVDAVRAVKDDW